MKKFMTLCLVLTLISALGVVTALASEGAHWGYDGEIGPEHWGTLSHDYAACAEGKEQSPIDVPEAAPVHSADIAFNYRPTALNVVNNGHAIMVNDTAGSSITVEGKTYNLLQFHFHSLSEHTLYGGYYDMEMHLVHQSADGEYAVVGVMMSRGAENEAYAPIWEHMPSEEGETETVSGASVNAADLLPGERSYYRYNGSFTTPPCTEGVKWFLMNNRVELSDAQIDAFREIYDHNYRPVQPFYDRVFNPSLAEAATPTLLPESGGAALPLENLLAGLGALTMAAGFYLRRRKAT